MSTKRKLFATGAILLSFLAINLIWRYFGLGKEHMGAFFIAMLVSIRLNIFLFTPRNKNQNV